MVLSGSGPGCSPHLALCVFASAHIDDAPGGLTTAPALNSNLHIPTAPGPLATLGREPG